MVVDLLGLPAQDHRMVLGTVGRLESLECYLRRSTDTVGGESLVL